MKVRITFTEPALGTRAGNKELATDHQASKHPNLIQADEIETIENIEEALEKGSTVFDRMPGGLPFMWDYQWRGYFKEACWATYIGSEAYTQKQLKDLGLTKWTYKRTIDKLIFVLPRKIIFDLHGGSIGIVERPLRGQTMRGERICLARSESLPIGTTCEFEIRWLNDKYKEPIIDWLDYGELGGTLQWRSGGHGRFTWEDITPIEKT